MTEKQHNNALADMVRGKRVALSLTGPGFSLRATAKKVGVTAPVLSRLETRGEVQVSPATLAKLFDALGLDRWQGFRVAGVADPDLTEMVRMPSRPLAALLRAGAKLSDEEWHEVLCHVIKQRKSAEKERA